MQYFCYHVMQEDVFHMPHNVVFDQEFDVMVKRFKRAIRGKPADQKLRMIEDPTEKVDAN